MPKTTVARALLCLSLLVAACPVVRADPNDYVHSPIVEEGEREIDFKFGTAKNRDGTRESALSVGLGYGINSWWFTEIYAKANRQTPDGWRYDALEWENLFQLTETGKYPVDLGLVVELEYPRDRNEGWELSFGPLLQVELMPKLVANMNLLFGRHFHSSTPSPMSMDYQWQLRYRWRQALEFGAQGFGSLGPWRDWLPADQQEHKAGPAVFGKLKLDAHHAINYNAAWLIGTNSNTARSTLRLQVEYEY